LLITGDHGFTVFATSQYCGYKRYNYDFSEHGGRCAKIEYKSDYQANDDHFVYENDNKECFLIPLKYVSLNKIPLGESHGGATPEEVLVPVIILSKEKGKIEYNIKIINYKLKIKDPQFKMKVFPKPKHKIILKINNKTYNMEFNKDGDIYIVNLKGLKVGNYDAIIEIGNFIKNINIEITGGLKEKDIL